MPARPPASSRSTVAGGHPRHVHGEHHDQRAGGRTEPAARPAARRRAAPRRVLAHERDRPAGRHLLADHDHLGRVRRRRPARARARSARRSSIAALSTPSSRAAVPPARTTAAYGGRRAHARSLSRRPAGVAGWGRGARQPSSSRPPGSSRTTTGPLLASSRPTTPTWSSFPEAFARDFGEAGSDVSAYAEPVDGAVRDRGRAGRRGAGTTVVAGMFETSGDPDRPYNTLVVRGAAAGGLPQDPPLRLLRLPRVRPARPPGEIEPVADRRSAASRSA